MPDTDPDNAPEPTRDTIHPTDGESAARQIAETGRGGTPGGGGLGGASAADALGGSARAPEGASPNAPIDTKVAPPEGEGAAEEREAQLRALAETPSEPNPKSL